MLLLDMGNFQAPFLGHFWNPKMGPENQPTASPGFREKWPTTRIFVYLRFLFFLLKSHLQPFDAAMAKTLFPATRAAPGSCLGPTHVGRVSKCSQAST